MYITAFDWFGQSPCALVAREALHHVSGWVGIERQHVYIFSNVIVCSPLTLIILV